MKVSDVMSRQVDYVKPDDKVERAALIIFGRNINGVPVCEGKKVVGFITESDILKKFYPTIQEFIEDSVHESNFEEMEEKAMTILSLPVSTLMSKFSVTVKPDTPLLKAKSLMEARDVGRLPVVDEDNKLMGMISKGDVYRSLIGEKLLFTENEDYNDFLSKTYYATVDWENRLKYEMPDLLRVFKEHNVKTVFDVGCGTGDHSIELARHGYSVIGVDRSNAMIREANRRKVALSSKDYGNVHFWHKDAEELLFDLDTNFDAILFLGNTFSHNPKNYRHLLKRASGYLSKDGVMIFQNTNFEKILKVNKRLLNFSFVNSREEPIREYCFVEFYDPPVHDKTILKTFAILVSDGKRWKWSGTRNSVMAFTDQEKMKSLLENEKFKDIKFFGSSFDGKHWDYLFREPFDPLKSGWLNIIASNKKS